MIRSIVLAVSLALILVPTFAPGAAAEEITATLHYVAGAPPSSPVLVTFGMPFPKGFLTDINLIRVKDAAGHEIPAHVRQLVPWRDLATGTNLPSIRSTLIQVNVAFGGASTLTLKVETGAPRTQNVATEQPVRSNWVMVDDAKYPAKWGVYEPPVYVTLPPQWLARCAVKALVVPYFTYPDFNWYDDPLTNSDPNKNFGQNFFRTAINDDPLVIPRYQIWYLEENPYTHCPPQCPPDEADSSPYEAWLYDRAMTMFTIYLRSGNVSVLREAHRAAFFYASQINQDGWFTFKPPEEGEYDLKYSYNESMFTDLLLLGDEGHLDKINNLNKAAATFVYAYKGDRRREDLWTERHYAYCWLPFIVAFEATGNAVYADEARKRADQVFWHQNHPPSINYAPDPKYPSYIPPPAPNDGALLHTVDHHEGVGTWTKDSGKAWWIFSPWQSVLLVDVMQRYYLHSGDQRVLSSAQRFGDAVINTAIRVRPPDGEPCEGLPIPDYLCSSAGAPYTEWDDFEHCLDVAKLLAFAYQGSILAGAPQEKYRTQARKLLESARLVTADWIRPEAHDYGKSIYRLSPPRKFNWWFRTTLDLDYLLNCRQASLIPLSLLLD